MADQSIACPSCGKKIPLTRALRAEIETTVRDEYAGLFETREQALRADFERQRLSDLARTREETAAHAGRELAAVKAQLIEQARALDEARAHEIALRKRERELERRHQELELTLQRKLDDERRVLIADAEQRILEQHRLKDAEKERQLSDMRRQIEDLKRRAEQGSQQLQGEAGEGELESVLKAACPADTIVPVAQGVRGADLHQFVVDARGGRAGTILWECKNAKHWSGGWIEKLKDDQRALRADVAVLVTASLPKGCHRFALLDGVIVTDFACAAPVAAILRAHLAEMAQARHAALHKGEKLELLHRYLSGTDFRHRVEAVVEAFRRMRDDLDQERRAAERQWARRAKQIEAVTFNICGLYGDLQGLVPSLPSIPRLELPAAEGEFGDDAQPLLPEVALEPGGRRLPS